jgi:hypothetical protein
MGKITVTNVLVVYLRKPRKHNKRERRDDPFWEFGSFGCTGCHRGNLMNPDKAADLQGTRLAFVQGGPTGVKLVHVTPKIEVCHHNDLCEARWRPAKMPLTYESAPIVVNNDGYSDFPLLRDVTNAVMRRTAVGKFASGFRSRRKPLPERVGEQLIAEYERFRRHSQVASPYDDAMPYSPPCLLSRKERKQQYELLLGLRSALSRKRRKSC